MKKELKIYLASPRGFCAGVKRAIDIVEKSINKFGSPVYVRHEIVHNKQVVEELKKKGNLKTILAAFEIQKTNFNFQESFDQRVDYICSEQRVYSL